MTDDEIKRDREVIAAATPGPYGLDDFDDDSITLADQIEENVIGYLYRKEDREFYHRARTRWPEALDALEAVTRERDELRASLAPIDMVDELREAAYRRPSGPVTTSGTMLLSLFAQVDREHAFDERAADTYTKLMAANAEAKATRLEVQILNAAIRRFMGGEHGLVTREINDMLRAAIDAARKDAEIP